MPFAVPVAVSLLLYLSLYLCVSRSLHPPPSRAAQAFHNEHDPHQAPLSALAKEEVGHIKADVYKVTAALIQTMDVQIGRLLGALNTSGMLDNIVIGFSSDNGGPLDHANNYPFRGGQAKPATPCAP